MLLSKALFFLGAEGGKNIPEGGGFILAANHKSFLDPAVLGICSSRQLNFMAKEELFENRFFRWWLNKVNVIPIRRKSADLSAIKSAIAKVKGGEGLLVFPEGTRQDPDKDFGDPEKGIGFLVDKLGCPVIPALVLGTDKAMPKGAKFIRPAKVKVYFGKQINVERGLPYQTIAGLVMAGIKELAEKQN